MPRPNEQPHFDSRDDYISQLQGSDEANVSSTAAQLDLDRMVTHLFRVEISTQIATHNEPGKNTWMRKISQGRLTVSNQTNFTVIER